MSSTATDDPQTDGSVHFNFSLREGLVIESIMAEGSTRTARLRGVIVAITNMEIVVWPIDSPMQATQMTVLPRQSAQYTILRGATINEIQQADAGVQSIIRNWQQAVIDNPLFVPDPPTTDEKPAPEIIVPSSSQWS